MDGRLEAPRKCEATNEVVDMLVEAEKVADDAAVEKGPVGVSIGEIGRLEFQIAELVKDGLGSGKLGIGEGAEVEDGEGFGRAYGDDSTPGLLTIGMPPVTQEPQGSVGPNRKDEIKIIVAK